MRLALSLALFAAAVALTACQALSAITGEDEGASMRGRKAAEQHCAACHAVARSGTSPLAAAPRFSDLPRRYTAPALLRELEASDAVGHYRMPVVRTSPAERDDLVAYIRSLDRGAAR